MIRIRFIVIALLIAIALPSSPMAKFSEAIVYHGYAKAGVIEVSVPPIIESDHPIDTKEIESVVSVVEEHHPGFDLTKPVKGQKIGDGVVTSPQGERVRPCPSCSRFHHGVDWAKSTQGGEPLYAPGRIEVVCKAQRNSAGILTGAGYYAEFDFYGMTWQLMHLQHNSCIAGGHEKGWVIGRVGTTGSSTGNHLHLGLLGPNGERLLVGTGHVAAVVIQEQ